MATSENYLTSIKCWLKLHSHLKEGDKIEDKRAKCQRLAWLPQNATPRPRCWGCRRAAGSRLRAAAALLLSFGESLSSGSFQQGAKDGLRWSTTKTSKTMVH